MSKSGVEQAARRPRNGAASAPRLSVGLAAAALLSLGACASSKPLPTPQVTPPAAYEAPRGAGSLAQAALDEWWKLYQDPQLEELVARALANSPDARDALAKLEQADAIRDQAIAQLYIPTGNLTAGATYSDAQVIGTAGAFIQRGGVLNLNSGFSSSWELDLWGRRRAGRASTNADFYTAAMTFEATRVSLVANVAQQLFQARGLAMQLRDAVETARISHETARLTDLRFRAGLAARADADQTGGNAQAADAQVESFRAQLAAARRSLLVLIGSAFAPLDTLEAAATVGTLPATPDVVPGDLLRRRPDIRAAESRLLSSKAVLRVNELALLPTLRLNPGVTLAKSGGPFAATQLTWSIASNLTVPVLDRPRLLAAVRAQHAVAEQNIIAYERAVQTAYGDVENAFVFLDSDRKRVATLVEAETRARSAYDKARLGYERGLNDLQTVLTAETSWRNVRTQLTNAQATLMQRSVQVFRTLGGGWSPDRPAAASPEAETVASVVEGMK